MWELDHKRAPKNWCFQIVVLEKTFEGPLDSKEIKPINPKGNKSWIFIRKTDAEAAILWPPHAKSWHIGKNSDAGRHWGQEEKGATEDEMVARHHWLDGHELSKLQEMDGDGQGGLVCCSPRGRKASDTTEQLNWLTLVLAFIIKSLSVWLTDYMVILYTTHF